MLYFLYIYQSNTGVLLYEKDLRIYDSSSMDLFGSFFSALKAFMSELAIEGLKNLKTIGLGTFTAFILTLTEILVDIVIIADKEDLKLVKKISPKLIEIIKNYKALLSIQKIDSIQFEDFDKDINEYIITNKKLTDSGHLIEKRDEILKSIWEQKGEISDRLRKKKREEEEELYKKRELLRAKLLGELNIIKKYRICKVILDLSLKIDKTSEVEGEFKREFQELAKTLYFQIEERKVRLNHYLTKTKEILKTLIKSSHKSLLSLNYRDVHSSLYAFSSRLKNFAPDIVYNQHLALARKLLEKKDSYSNTISELINQILNLEDDITSYFPPEA